MDKNNQSLDDISEGENLADEGDRSDKDLRYVECYDTILGPSKQAARVFLNLQAYHQRSEHQKHAGGHAHSYTRVNLARYLVNFRVSSNNTKAYDLPVLSRMDLQPFRLVTFF